jgi:hypothetical protein
VAGNSVIANRRHGMVLKQLDNSRVAHNLVVGHNRGFFVQQANQNRFEGNIVATNDIGLHLSGGSEKTVFVGNAFIRNADQVWLPAFETQPGRKASNAFFEKNHGNYWSDYTGTDRNQDGIGDTPYHETALFGYLVDRQPEARVFALSPAVALLRKGEELMPLLETIGVTDRAPLMSPRIAVIVTDARPHPDPLSQEKESKATRPVNSSDPFAVATIAPFTDDSVARKDASILPGGGGQFSISLGERAGVRAGVSSELQSPLRR